LWKLARKLEARWGSFPQKCFLQLRAFSFKFPNELPRTINELPASKAFAEHLFVLEFQISEGASASRAFKRKKGGEHHGPLS
jgi:hypothetical protein